MNQKNTQKTNQEDKNSTGIKPLSCYDIQKASLLVDHIAGTMAEVDHHLASCPSCQEEYQLLQQLMQDSNALANECETVMASINWEDNAMAISNNIPFKPSTPMIARGFVFNWYRAAAAVIIVFAMGIAVGYQLFHSPSSLGTPDLVRTKPSANLSLARLETSVAKREVTQYFQQSQLVLTDLLEKCNTQTSFSWKDHLDMKRVQALLSKSRYFNQDLGNPDLLSSRDLLKKIQWLLYEIMMNDKDGSCVRLQKLQDYVRQERLLFKIHLVGKELSLSEV